MSTNTSQSTDSVLTGQLREQPTMEDIAASIQQGKDEAEVIKLVKCLSAYQTDLQVEKWKTPSSQLNLIQLAVLHRQKSLAENLLIQHRGFMHRDLYLMCRHFSKSQGSVVKFSPNQEHSSSVPSNPEQQKGQLSSNSLQVETDSSVQQAAFSSHQPAEAVHSPKAATFEQQQVEEGEAKEDILENHPLHLACWLGDVEMVRCLVKPGVSSAERKKFSHNQERSSPVPSDQSKEELQDLMRTVCTITVGMDDPETQTHPEGLPLELAVSSGSVACVKYLLSRVLLPWVSSQYYFMCVELKRKAVTLHLACCFSAPKVVAFLLPALSKEIVHCRDGQGQTPLHFAVWNGDTETIRLLLENGADVNALTDSSNSCLHILYRSMLQPCNYEANTHLLLQHGANVNISGKVSNGNNQKPLSPLHVLIEEIMDSTSASMNLWERRFGQKAGKGLLAYTQSRRPARHLSSWSDYLQGLIRCLRLLLEAGANPNSAADVQITYSTFKRKTPLELVLSREENRLMEREPEAVCSVVSMLLGFGATLTGDSAISYLVHFLNRASSTKIQKEASYINVFCENGVSADAVGRGLLAFLRQHPGQRLSWSIACLQMLANKMSTEGLTVLSYVLHSPRHQNEDFEQVLSPLYGSPVRSLSHMCKVVVLQHVGNKSCKIEALRVPDMVKLYLKAHDYN